MQAEWRASGSSQCAPALTAPPTGPHTILSYVSRLIAVCRRAEVVLQPRLFSRRHWRKVPSNTAHLHRVTVRGRGWTSIQPFSGLRLGVSRPNNTTGRIPRGCNTNKDFKAFWRSHFGCFTHHCSADLCDSWSLGQPQPGFVKFVGLRGAPLSRTCPLLCPQSNQSVDAAAPPLVQSVIFAWVNC